MVNRIALVDDDQNILVSVSMALETEGFEVKTYPNGEEGLKGLLEDPPDLAILDIKMPRMDGIELLTKLRETSSLPVIFLTSKSDEVDEIVGLRLGADDYVTKPFSQRLLIERIRTILRRNEEKRKTVPAETEKDAAQIVVGPLILDTKRFLCTWKDEFLTFTVTEFLLLKALAEHPGHVKTRDQLIDIAYGETIYVDDRTIDSHIKRVRRKFKNIDSDFSNIQTVYGAGYKYVTA